MQTFGYGLPHLVIAGAVAVVLGIAIASALKPKSRGPTPPGPKGLPIIGNVLDVPLKRPWLGFTDLALQYGPVYSLSILSRHIVVLNSLDVMSEALTKRDVASRPAFVVAGELMDFNRTTPLAQEGPVHRMHRRLSHIALNPTAVTAFTATQTECIRRCVQRLETSDFEKEVRLAVASSVVEMVYGIKVDSIEHPFIVCADTVFEIMSDAVRPGRYLADFLPFLKHIPPWFPGAGFKRDAARVREQLDRMCTYPFELVKDNMSSGSASQSFVGTLLDSVRTGSLEAVNDETIASVAGTLYGGGVDTTYSTVMTFILAALLTPRVQVKAQEELDRVLGTERLPDINDRPNLPYIRAVVKESLRFYPAGPIGVPRAVAKDTTIGGYSVRQGTIVIPNVWNISRQVGCIGMPADEFHPERFLGESPPPDPSTYVFGAGRRVCVGQAVAENFLFIMVASLLASYTILPVIDGDGKEVKPTLSWIDLTLTRPEPFMCRFVPRTRSTGRPAGEASE